MAYYDKQAGKIVYGQGNQAPKPYTIDDYIKTNNQFKKGYDANTNTAYLTDTKTGKTLSFLSGQGQEYGFGGIKNGSNVISDLNKLNSFFNTPATTENKSPDIPTLNNMANTNNSANTTNAANTNTFKSDYDPKTLEYLSKMQNRQYTSPYAQDITDTLAKIQNMQNFNYNPETDAGLGAAQESAQNSVSRGAARRGMLYSDSNKSQMGRAALELVPQFRNQAFQEYQNQQGNMYNQLSALNNLENAAYQRYQGEGADLYNQANLVSNLANNDYNRYNADRAFNTGQENQKLQQLMDYNKSQGKIYNPNTGQFEVDPAVEKARIQGLTSSANDYAQRTGFYNPYAQYELTPEKLAEVNPYFRDLTAEIQRRQQTPDKTDDALIPYLQNAKFQKVMSLPQEQRYQIGNDSGYLTQEGLKNYIDIQNTQTDIAGKQYDNIIKQAKASVAGELEQLGLQKAANEVYNGSLKNAMDEINLSWLPQEKKMQMQNVISTIENREVMAGIAQQNANTSAQNADTSAYNAETSRMNSNRSQSQFEDKQLENTYNDVDNYIQSVYTSVGEGNRQVMTERDKADIGAYLDGLATDGVPISVIKALRSKYNIGR